MNHHIQHLSQGAKWATQMFIDTAKGTPEDKRQSSPGGAATTVVWNINHCLHFPEFIKASVEKMEASQDYNQPDFGFDEAISELISSTESYCEYVQSVPEEKLTQEITFPWGTYTVASVLSWHEWNLTYHLGQLNYIQLILGDNEMHM